VDAASGDLLGRRGRRSGRTPKSGRGEVTLAHKKARISWPDLADVVAYRLADYGEAVEMSLPA